ncbi:MAG: hypothetical protein ACOC5R_04665 [Elusimicrobiota bacterium]
MKTIKNAKLYIIIIAAILIVGIFAGWRIAGMLGGGAGLLSIFTNGKSKEADKIDDEKEELEDEAKDIDKEGKEREEKAEKLSKEDKKRDEEAEELDDDLKKTESKFKDMFKILIVIFVSFSLLFALSGITMADEPEIDPDNFKRPDTMAEAEHMIDKLLDITLEYRETAHEYKSLYEAEKQSKKEYKSLYEAEKESREELKSVVDDMSTLMEKQREILDELMDSKKLGLYGGVNYTPFKPKNSGVDAGININF